LSVGYAGLESGFQDAVGIPLQLVILVSSRAYVSSVAEAESSAPARLAPRDASNVQAADDGLLRRKQGEGGSRAHMCR
jgi:hypothetical protein